MKELKQYVDQKCAWHALFNKNSPYLDLQKSGDRQRVANMLDSDLSPENLTCDGEAPMRQVIARKRFLEQAAKQLMKLDPTVKFYEFS